MMGEQGTTDDALGRFRAAVLAEPALQRALDGIEDLEVFIARATALAQDRGLVLDPASLRTALRGDPLGIDRWADAPLSRDVPQRGWLPINILPARNDILVDWGYFGERALIESFYEDSIRQVLQARLNRLARHRTRLIDLPNAVAQQDVLAPSGFIFHMSRCGSTLAAQMLAADPANIVVSEAAPIDTVVRLNVGPSPEAKDLHASLLRAMVGALGQRRTAAHAHSFVKLDSWHTLALPLFAKAFPGVPWVFLYREPSEVLASQMAQRGIQTVPEYLPPHVFDLTADDARDPDAYCAKVLARTCEAVLEPFAQGGGLLVNYRDLPGALWSAILPHFGVDIGPVARERMTTAAKFDAKSPNTAFAGDTAAKRDLLTGDLRGIAERHVGGIYRRLEELRHR